MRGSLFEKGMNLYFSNTSCSVSNFPERISVGNLLHLSKAVKIEPSSSFLPWGKSPKVAVARVKK